MDAQHPMLNHQTNETSGRARKGKETQAMKMNERIEEKNV